MYPGPTREPGTGARSAPRPDRPGVMPRGDQKTVSAASLELARPAAHIVDA